MGIYRVKPTCQKLYWVRCSSLMTRFCRENQEALIDGDEAVHGSASKIQDSNQIRANKLVLLKLYL
jgi:hypothetical protein